MNPTRFDFCNGQIARTVFLVLVLTLTCSKASADWYSQVHAIMGTEVHIELWHDNQTYADASMALVMKEMQRIDTLMSTYKEDSELSLVNREAATQAVKVSDELFELIKSAIDVGKLTAGAFDITYASVGQYYDYRAGQKPTEEQIQASVNLIDLEHVKLDEQERSISFARGGVRIDLGGIAKGYAVESAVRILSDNGIRHAIVSAGGDSRILGDRKGRPWAVGIRDPRNSSGLIARLPVQDEAISTSGDYERYFESNGERYHHILSPVSGKSADKVRSVTIIGPDAVMTDALSTGVFVMGMSEGLALIDSMENFEAVIIDAAGTMHFSTGLQPGA